MLLHNFMFRDKSVKHCYSHNLEEKKSRELIWASAMQQELSHIKSDSTATSNFKYSKGTRYTVMEERIINAAAMLREHLYTYCTTVHQLFISASTIRKAEMGRVWTQTRICSDIKNQMVDPWSKLNKNSKEILKMRQKVYLASNWSKSVWSQQGLQLLLVLIYTASH